MGLSNLRQVKLQPRRHQRSQFAFFFKATVQFVAACFEREDFKRFVGWIADPIFLHAEAGVEFLLVVAVAAHAGRRNQFDQQVRSSEDGALLKDAEVGGGNEKQIRLDGVTLKPTESFPPIGLAFVFLGHLARRIYYSSR